jgi:prepilin-type N-terminal cleavage/methylation domain-containing protein/prepilin-type processing-associated H-X9-DG protein
MREFRQSIRCHANPSSEVRRAVCGHSTGFTLIELLLTLAIILILTSIYWAGGTGDPEKRKKTCAQNLRKLHLVLQIYANDNGGLFPANPAARTSEEALDVLVPRYTSDTAVFICPGSRDSSLPSGKSIRSRRISYAYYMGLTPRQEDRALMSDRQVDAESKREGQVVFSPSGKPPGNNHKQTGGNLLFCDGHVEFAPVRAPISLVLTQGVVLLNPKP